MLSSYALQYPRNIIQLLLTLIGCSGCCPLLKCPEPPQLVSLQASKLQQSRDTSASQLRGLVERHRFLRAVCTFHAASEDEVLFPAVK